MQPSAANLSNPNPTPEVSPDISGETHNQSPLKRYLIVLAFGALIVLAWVAWTTFWDTGLYGDNVEQFVWAHRMELGYYKHPPLPTWLLGLATSLVGSHWWLTNALAALCVMATGILTWLIAARLFGERTANVAIVLWSLQQSFSVSAEIYNHNTLLVLCMSAMTYAVLRALTTEFDTRWWLASGALAACAMLSKYQAALPLLALLVVVFAVRKKPISYLAWRMALVLLVFFLLFGPHLYWGLSNQFPSLRYASEALESGGLVRRMSWVLTFAANQIRMVLPLLLAIAICMLLTRFNHHRSTHKLRLPVPAPVARDFGATFNAKEVSIWMWSLVWGPVLAVLALSLVSGSALRNHWGIQLFQFFSLWVAWRWRQHPVLGLRNLIAAALVAHSAGFIYYAVKQSDPNAALAERRADSSYPAQRMSDAAVAHWKSLSNCPLRIVAGDFEAGLVSAYSKETPVVFTGPVATPWLSSAEITQHGALYVFDNNTALPADVTAATRWYLSKDAAQNKKYVQFAVRLPAKACNTV